MKGFSLLFLAMTVLLSSCTTTRVSTIHQVGSWQQMAEGKYDGVLSIKPLKELGDFGIGTFHAFDGEMVAHAGNIYQTRSGGEVRLAPENLTTPYATLHHFNPSFKRELFEVADLEQLFKLLKHEINSGDLIYAIQIKGYFDAIKLRSPRVQKKPYPSLDVILQTQFLSEHKNIRGTLVGYFIPKSIQGITIPGFHFHFISEDKKTGGHVLDISLKQALAHFEEISRAQAHLFAAGD